MSRKIAKLIEKGFRYVDSERWDEAEDLFEEALVLDPDCPRALMGRGRVRAYNRDFDTACGRFTERNHADAFGHGVGDYRWVERYF